MDMRKKNLFLVVLCISINLFADNFDEKQVFTGFDFEADFDEFSHSLDSIIEDKDYPRLENYHDQVLIAHSQGGLRALGYLHEMKNHGRLHEVSALVTVDSPVVGFAGLDYGYSTCRQKLLSDVTLLDKGVTGLLGLPGTIIDYYDVTEQLNFLLSLINDVPMEDLMEVILNKSSADSSIVQITDMGRNSAFVRENVRETSVETVRYIKGRRREPGLVKVTKKIMGVRVTFYLPGMVTVPIYGYINQIVETKNNVLLGNRIGHIVGTDNDPLHLMSPENEDRMRNFGLDMELALRASQVGNYTTGLSLGGYLTGTGSAWMRKASDCNKAANWILNYSSEWGDLIGGDANDGFIAEHTQVLPGTPQTRIRRVHIDHRRAMPPDEIFEEKSSYSDEKIASVYWQYGSIKDVLNEIERTR